MSSTHHHRIGPWLLLWLTCLTACASEGVAEVGVSAQALTSGLVQSATATTTLSTSISAELDATPTPGNLLVAIESHPSAASSFTHPNGWSIAVNNANQSPGQIVYYKVAGASESRTVSVSSFPFLNNVHSLRVMEFSGFDGKNPPLVATKTSSLLTSFSLPTVTTNAPSALLLTSVISVGSLLAPSFSSWSNGFSALGSTLGFVLRTESIGAAFRIGDTAASYTTTALLSVLSSNLGHTLAFNRLPIPVDSMSVTGGLQQNLVTFSALEAPSTHIELLTKTGDCSFSAIPTGSEARGASVGNATVIFNDSPSANLSAQSVSVAGVSTSVLYNALTRTLTHSSLSAGTLYCYRIFVRNSAALDSDSVANPKTRSATPFSLASAGPLKFTVSSGSTNLAAASIIPGQGAFYADSGGRLMTVRSTGIPDFASYQLPDGVQSRSPAGVLTGDTEATAFLSSLNGDIYAVWASGASAGSLRWSSVGIDGDSLSAGDQPLGAALYAAPLVSNTLTRVFASTRNAAAARNRIYALHATTGACVWVLNGTCAGATGTLNIGQISAVPLLDAVNSRLLFTSAQLSGGPTVWAVDARDSATGDRVLWSRTLGSSDSSLSFTSHTREAILVGTNAGRIYMLNASDGTTCWGSTGDGCGTATGTEQFFCTDPTVNARAAACTSGSAISKNIVPVNGTFLGNFVFTTADGNVRMINSQGVQVWRTQIAGASPPLPLPTVGQGKLYVGGSDGLVYELALSTGAVTASRSVGGGSVVASAPAYDATDATLHLTTSQGNQYAFNVPF